MYGLNPVASLLYFMTPERKEELKRNLEHTNKTGVDFISIDDTPEWREAFAAYNEIHKTNLTTKSGCSRCFISVKAWLYENA